MQAPHEQKHGEKAKKKKVDMARNGVYVGETGRSLNERFGDHWGDACKMVDNSHIVKHQD